MKDKKDDFEVQQRLGKRISGWGYLLLFAVFITCCIDLVAAKFSGQMMVPLSGYLLSIFAGVLMQFIGAAVPKMCFSDAAK